MEDLESMLLKAMDGTPEDKNRAIATILLDMRKQDQKDLDTLRRAQETARETTEKAERERKRCFRLAVVCAVCAALIWAAALALMFGVVVEAETTYSTVEQSTDGGGNAYYNAEGTAEYIIGGGVE